jgi:hypothetical protein
MQFRLANRMILQLHQLHCLVVVRLSQTDQWRHRSPLG